MGVLQEQYKDTKIGRIPKDWEVIKLGETCEFYRGQAFAKSEIIEDGEKECIHYGELFTIYSEIIRKIYSKTNSEVIRASEVGDILMPSSDVTPIGLATASVINSKGVLIGGDVNIIRPIVKLDSIYLSYLINYEKKKIIRLISGTNVKHIYNGNLKTLHYALPPLPEQQKIAEILSTIDEQIINTQAIIDKSKELKKGLMQKLFSEGIGHAEFKDTKIGRIPKDWEVVKIADIGIVIDSLHQTPKFSDAGYPMVRVGDINKSKLTLDNCLTVPKDVFEAFTKKHLPRKGDILITRVGSFGKTILVEDDSPFCLGQNTAIITGISNEKYAYYMLNSHPIIKQIGVLTNGSTQPSLSLKEIRNIKISVGSEEEQQKIADILSEADAKIEKEEQEKAQLEQLKKGLM